MHCCWSTSHAAWLGRENSTSPTSWQRKVQHLDTSLQGMWTAVHCKQSTQARAAWLAEQSGREAGQTQGQPNRHTHSCRPSAAAQPQAPVLLSTPAQAAQLCSHSCIPTPLPACTKPHQQYMLPALQDADAGQKTHPTPAPVFLNASLDCLPAVLCATSQGQQHRSQSASSGNTMVRQQLHALCSNPCQCCTNHNHATTSQPNTTPHPRPPHKEQPGKHACRARMVVAGCSHLLLTVLATAELQHSTILPVLGLLICCS